MNSYALLDELMSSGGTTWSDWRELEEAIMHLLHHLKRKPDERAQSTLLQLLYYDGKLLLKDGVPLTHAMPPLERLKAVALQGLATIPHASVTELQDAARYLHAKAISPALRQLALRFTGS